MVGVLLLPVVAGPVVEPPVVAADFPVVCVPVVGPVPSSGISFF